MEFDSAAAFELLRQSSSTGFLDRLVAAADWALDRTMRESGLDMGDLLALLDSASLETVLRVEEMVGSREFARAAAWLKAETADPGSGEKMAGAMQRYLRQAAAEVALTGKPSPLERDGGEV